MKTFKQHLEEEKRKEITFSHPPTKTVAKVRAFHGPEHKTAWIDSLTTPEEHRGKGGAHQVMRQVTDYLDKHQLSGQLSAVPLDKQTNEKKLQSFYKKYGFSGKTYMMRKPKK